MVVIETGVKIKQFNNNPDEMDIIRWEGEGGNPGPARQRVEVKKPMIPTRGIRRG